MPRLLMPLILPAPPFVCISSWIFDTQRWECGHLRIFRPSIQILLILSLCLYRLKQLFPPIFLNPELLFYSSYLACRIRIKVGLLQFLYETFNFLQSLFYDSMLSLNSQSDGSWWLYSTGPVEIIITIFELFDERDSLVIAGVKFSSHKKI